MKEFKGKTAVVTGAASGIGFGLAEKFAQEQMQVVLADCVFASRCLLRQRRGWGRRPRGCRLWPLTTKASPRQGAPKAHYGEVKPLL